MTSMVMLPLTVRAVHAVSAALISTAQISVTSSEIFLVIFLAAADAAAEGATAL